jgi:hypothetical protein
MVIKYSLICFIVLIIFSFNHQLSAEDDNKQVDGEIKSFEEENYGVRYADDCEGIKFDFMNF